MKLLRRYAPVDRFRSIADLGRLMDEMWGDSASDVRSGWMPPVDIKETATDLTFYAEVPGMKQEDIEIEIVGDVLTIRGKREFTNEERQDDFVRVERNYGSFQRSFTVGVPVKVGEINATYSNGVLTVQVPKADTIQPRKIEISDN
jgi:HSP20 family protein